MKHREIVMNWTNWAEYLDPAGETSREQFEAMSIDERLAIVTDCFGPEPETVEGLSIGMRVVVDNSETDDRGVIVSFDEDDHTAFVNWDHAPARACNIDFLVPEEGW